MLYSIVEFLAQLVSRKSKEISGNLKKMRIFSHPIDKKYFRLLRWHIILRISLYKEEKSGV